MAFRGDPHKVGAGRKKGTPNKVQKETVQMLTEKCEARGIDPFNLLLDFCGEAPPELRLAALKEICSYLYPKRKEIQVQANIDIALVERIKTLSELPDDELLAIAHKELKLVNG